MKSSEHLRQLFGAYFHQDWAAEVADWRGVVAVFVKENTPAYVARTADELERLAQTDLAESELAALLSDELGCCYLPRPDLGGPSCNEWLHQLAAELRANTAAV